jgi:hypothetical protein
VVVTYFAARDGQVVACELSAARSGDRSIRSRVLSLHGNWPDWWWGGLVSPPCQVVWRDEPLVLSPGGDKPFWIDAPLAAAIGDASIRRGDDGDEHTVCVIVGDDEQLSEHLVAVDPRKPVPFRARSVARLDYAEPEELAPRPAAEVRRTLVLWAPDAASAGPRVAARLAGRLGAEVMSPELVLLDFGTAWMSEPHPESLSVPEASAWDIEIPEALWGMTLPALRPIGPDGSRFLLPPLRGSVARSPLDLHVRNADGQPVVRIRGEAVASDPSEPERALVLQVAACPPTGSLRVELYREHDEGQVCETCGGEEVRTRDGRPECVACGVERTTPPLVHIRRRSRLQVGRDPRGRVPDVGTARAPVAACILHGPGPTNPDFLDRAVHILAELARVNALDHLVINRVLDGGAGSARAAVGAMALAKAGPAGLARLATGLSTRPAEPGCGLFETLRAAVEPPSWSAAPADGAVLAILAEERYPLGAKSILASPSGRWSSFLALRAELGVPLHLIAFLDPRPEAGGGRDLLGALEHLVLLGRQARYPEALVRVWGRPEAPPRHDADLVLKVAERAAEHAQAGIPRPHFGVSEARGFKSAEARRGVEPVR